MEDLVLYLETLPRTSGMRLYKSNNPMSHTIKFPKNAVLEAGLNQTSYIHELTNFRFRCYHMLLGMSSQLDLLWLVRNKESCTKMFKNITLFILAQKSSTFQSKFRRFDQLVVTQFSSVYQQMQCYHHTEGLCSSGWSLEFLRIKSKVRE